MAFDPAKFDVDNEEALKDLSDQEIDALIEHQSLELELIPDGDDGPSLEEIYEADKASVEDAIENLPLWSQVIYKTAKEAGATDEICLMCRLVFLAHEQVKECKGDMRICPYAHVSSERGDTKIRIFPYNPFSFM